MPRNQIQGNNRDNVLRGTNDGDNIQGLGGADNLIGRQGNDLLFGGTGADTLDGGAGNDVLAGGNGHDWLKVSGGEDELRFGRGNDTLDASTWEDGVWLNLAGFTSTDFAPGDGVDGTVVVANGTMRLRDDGPNADWTEQQVSGDFEIFKGSGSRDWVNMSISSELQLVNLRGGHDYFSGYFVEEINGGGGRDRISIHYGTANGGRGADTLSASARDGTAKLFGNQGADTLIVSNQTIARGGAGNDTLNVLTGVGEDQLFGGSGADIFAFNPTSSASGVMMDFVPGVDRIDLSGYAGVDDTITWTSLQTMFKRGDTGVMIKLDSQRFLNQEFEFAGLTRSQLSESDFIL